MPYQTATLDGEPVFGLVIECIPTPIPCARQITEFFGQNGRLAVFGGTRGWKFTIKGRFEESDISTINADFAAIEGFAGPQTHTFVDTAGNTYQNVIFDGSIVPDGTFMITDTGWTRGYTMTMESLS
jgi:hypothetical protein